MYYIYHIPGYKIGVTKNPLRRIEKEQGYKEHEYELLEASHSIDYVSKREIELQRRYGYRKDLKTYKQTLNDMKIIITEKTSSFPCSKEDLSSWLLKHVGQAWSNDVYSFHIDNQTIDWIINNSFESQFYSDSCYIFNEPFSSFLSSQRLGLWMNGESTFDKIRQWAKVRGIYDSGDPKTQLIKLFEEAGELAQSTLKNDEPGIIDAIGDCIVVLTNLAHLNGLKIEDCIDSAYNEIANRKGEMKNGTFIKEQ